MGSLVNNMDNTTSKIERIFFLANNTYGPLNLLCSHLVIRDTQLPEIPVLMFDSETWTHSKQNELHLGCFEKKNTV